MRSARSDDPWRGDSPDAVFWAATVGALAPLVSVGATLLLWDSLAVPPPRAISPHVFAAVLTSLLLVLFATVGSRSRFGSRSAVIASFATLGLPCAMAVPLADQPWCVISLGYVHYDVSHHALCALSLPVLLLVVPIVVAQARTHLNDGRVRAGALAVIAAVAAVDAAALSRVRRPDMETYAASLSFVQSLQLGGSLALTDGTRVLYRRVSDSPDPNWVPADQSSRRRCRLEGLDEASFTDERCGPLTVWHDSVSDVWVFDQSPVPEHLLARVPVLAAGTFFERVAFIGAERRSRDIFIADVGRSLAPPFGWIIGSSFGLMMAGVLLAVAVRFDRRRAALGRAVDAWLGLDGWATSAGSPPVSLAVERRLPTGPVVLWLQRHSVASYRAPTPPTVESWQHGTVELLKSDFQARATSFYALAVTSALLCAGPLLCFPLTR